MSNKESYASIKAVTPEIQIKLVEKEYLFNGTMRYFDADDELLEIANHISVEMPHNRDVAPDKIKYLYATKAKKEGGRYTIGQLYPRSELDKMTDDENGKSYDYILVVFYKTWKSLDIENKVLQLDKLLCGVQAAEEKASAKKKQTDSREYLSNMDYFGAPKVINSSKIVELSIESIIEKEKEQAKNARSEVQIDDTENE